MCAGSPWKKTADATKNWENLEDEISLKEEIIFIVLVDY